MLQSEAATASTAAAKALLKRAPGRPRKVVDAATVLAAAADALPDTAEPPAKRSNYAPCWFASHIHDILDAYRIHSRSANRTVTYRRLFAAPLPPPRHRERRALRAAVGIHCSRGLMIPASCCRAFNECAMT